MADNITIKDAAAVDKIMKTTEGGGSVHVPHHVVDSIVAALPAGTNAIGKLAANSGVDIGDVDVTSCALPTGAATAANQATVIGHVDGIETLLTAANVDHAAIEVLLTAANVDHAANEALLTTIAGDTTSLDGKVTACNTGAVVLAAGTAGIGKLTANSGVDIGDVDVTSVSIPSAIYHGKTTVSTAGTEVTLASSQAITSGVTIKALSSNTGLIFVGANPVTSSTGFELNAKESVFLEVANLTTVWIDCAVNGEGVTYIAS